MQFLFDKKVEDVLENSALGKPCASKLLLKLQTTKTYTIWKYTFPVYANVVNIWDITNICSYWHSFCNKTQAEIWNWAKLNFWILNIFLLNHYGQVQQRCFPQPCHESKGCGTPKRWIVLNPTMVTGFTSLGLFRWKTCA